MAGIYKPPIRLAILDLYARQTGDLFKAEITALYTTNSLLAKVGLPQFLYFLPIFCGDRASAPYGERDHCRYRYVHERSGYYVNQEGISHAVWRYVL